MSNPRQRRLFLEMLTALAELQRQITEVDVAIARYLIQRGRRARRRRREIWTRDWILRRSNLGQFDTLTLELRAEDAPSYFNYMRMPPELFDEILRRVGPSIQRQHTFFRPPIPAAMKVAVTLRYLGSGDKYTSLMYAFRLPKNTIAGIIPEVCQAINDEFEDECIKCPETPEEWKEISDLFATRWNIPHAIGALDGKHVACYAPKNSGTMYYNYKGFFSIILLALVDADYKYIWVSVGSNGASSDAQIFNHSELKEAIEEGYINFPAAEPIPGETRPLPFFILGDDAFALKTWLMKPYAARNLTNNKRIFNYRLSRGRRIVENVFGVTASKFQVLHTNMRQQPKVVTKVVLTCCILHNLIRRRYGREHANVFDREDNDNHDVIPGPWRQRGNLEDSGIAEPGNTGTAEGKRQRAYLTRYFNSERGKVPWQENMI